MLYEKPTFFVIFLKHGYLLKFLSRKFSTNKVFTKLSYIVVIRNHVHITKILHRKTDKNDNQRLHSKKRFLLIRSNNKKTIPSLVEKGVTRKVERGFSFFVVLVLGVKGYSFSPFALKSISRRYASGAFLYRVDECECGYLGSSGAWQWVVFWSWAVVDLRVCLGAGGRCSFSRWYSRFVGGLRILCVRHPIHIFDDVPSRWLYVDRRVRARNFLFLSVNLPEPSTRMRYYWSNCLTSTTTLFCPTLKDVVRFGSVFARGSRLSRVEAVECGAKGVPRNACGGSVRHSL